MESKLPTLKFILKFILGRRLPHGRGLIGFNSGVCRDLIRSVRQCKTAQDERNVIAKEGAALRKAFKEQDGRYRHRYVVEGFSFGGCCANSCDRTRGVSCAGMSPS